MLSVPDCQHRHLQHKNLVQLLGVVFDGSTLKGIVMELMVKVSGVRTRLLCGFSSLDALKFGGPVFLSRVR